MYILFVHSFLHACIVKRYGELFDLALYKSIYYLLLLLFQFAKAVTIARIENNNSIQTQKKFINFL